MPGRAAFYSQSLNRWCEAHCRQQRQQRAASVPEFGRKLSAALLRKSEILFRSKYKGFDCSIHYARRVELPETNFPPGPRKESPRTLRRPRPLFARVNSNQQIKRDREAVQGVRAGQKAAAPSLAAAASLPSLLVAGPANKRQVSWSVSAPGLDVTVITTTHPHLYIDQSYRQHLASLANTAPGGPPASGRHCSNR